MKEVQVLIILPTSVVWGADEWSINQVDKDEQGNQQTPEGCPANQRGEGAHKEHEEHTRNTKAALQGCGAHEGYEGSPPGLRRAQGTVAALQGAVNRGGPPGDTKLEQPSRRHEAGAALQETRSWSGPPGDTKLKRPSRAQGTGAAIQGAGNRGSPPGRREQGQPSRVQGTGVALQETRSWSGPPGNTEHQHTTRKTNRQPRDQQTH
ncbi:hypothetical protein D4764_14G0003350 [Takifugu flavidus]|uniref:Uncharacterized protein n=1 Tax=Takifugu flavidus TaxID=433684 RepID=A0A5C6P3D4_9TELE|nr:hypothetical protein D4764_14G0003350 [Takifugu flavidus]